MRQRKGVGKMSKKYIPVELHEIVCPVCGKKFWGDNRQKYDSVLCEMAAMRKRNNEKAREKRAAKRQALNNEQV